MFNEKHELALMLENQNKYEKAEKIYQQVLKLKKTVLNSEHFFYANKQKSSCTNAWQSEQVWESWEDVLTSIEAEKENAEFWTFIYTDKHE